MKATGDAAYMPAENKATVALRDGVDDVQLAAPRRATRQANSGQFTEYTVYTALYIIQFTVVVRSSAHTQVCALRCSTETQGVTIRCMVIASFTIQRTVYLCTAMHTVAL